MGEQPAWDPEWWIAEVENDPAYQEDVVPLLLRTLMPRAGLRYLDMGCGEGQVMRSVTQASAEVVGCDLSHELLERAHLAGPVVRSRLPSLAWAANRSFDGAYAVLVVEHIGELGAMFAETARAVRPGGVLAVVSNHPAFTAPGAGPLIDVEDGEVTWRWGPYLQDALNVEPGGRVNIHVYHRPLSRILSAAADAGWSLLRIEEVGIGSAAAERDPVLARQANIPRLIGICWENQRLS